MFARMQLPRKKSVRFWDMPYEETLIHNSDGEEIQPDFTPLRTGACVRACVRASNILIRPPCVL